MSIMRVFALLTVLITIGTSAVVCSTAKDAGATPWVVLLVGMIIAGVFYNRGSKPRRESDRR